MTQPRSSRWFDAALGCDVEVWCHSDVTLLAAPGNLVFAESAELAVALGPGDATVRRLHLTPVLDRENVLRVVSAGGILPMTPDFFDPDPPDARYKVVLRSRPALHEAVQAAVTAGASLTEAVSGPGTDGFPRGLCLPDYGFHNLFIVPPSSGP